MLLPRSGVFGDEISPHQKALYALGVGFAAYGLAVLPPEGNGFIAVFVCAIVLGIRRQDLRVCFEKRSEDMIELVKLGIFVVFGSLLTLDGLFSDGVAAAAIAAFTLLLARPIAVFVALAGTSVGGADEGVHGLVRPQGRGHHDLLADRARRRDWGRGRRSSTLRRSPCSCRSWSTA